MAGRTQMHPDANSLCYSCTLYECLAVARDAEARRPGDARPPIRSLHRSRSSEKRRVWSASRTPARRRPRRSE